MLNLDEIFSCANTLQEQQGVSKDAAMVAAMMGQLTIAVNAFLEKETGIPTVAPAKPEEKKSEDKPVQKPVTEAPEIDLETIRAAFADKAKAGHKKACLSVLERFGVKTAANLKPADFPAVMAELEAL